MRFPEDLRYHPEHTWARIDGEVATAGITDFAQDELGELVFVGLPAVGSAVAVGEVFGSVESSKSISELFSPVSGEIVEVNSELEDFPEWVNDDPYGKGWMVRVRIGPEFDSTTLLDAAAYAGRVGTG